MSNSKGKTYVLVSKKKLSSHGNISGEIYKDSDRVNDAALSFLLELRQIYFTVNRKKLPLLNFSYSEAKKILFSNELQKSNWIMIGYVQRSAKVLLFHELLNFVKTQKLLLFEFKRIMKLYLTGGVLPE